MKCPGCGAEVFDITSLCPACRTPVSTSMPGLETTSDPTKVSGQQAQEPNQTSRIPYTIPPSITSQPVMTPESEIVLLTTEARQLHSDYDSAYNSFRKNNAAFTALAGFAGEKAKSKWGVSKKISDRVADALRISWEESQTYKDLSQRFDVLFDKTTDLLKATSENTGTLVPPGNSKKQLSMLGNVRKAARLDTKIKRIITALETISLKPLIFNKDIPPMKIGTRKRTIPHGGKAHQTPSFNKYGRTDDTTQTRLAHPRTCTIFSIMAPHRELCLGLGVAFYLASLSIFTAVEVATVSAPSLHDLGNGAFGEDFILATAHLVLGVMGIGIIDLGILGLGSSVSRP